MRSEPTMRWSLGMATHEQQAKQWKRNFEMVLNCPEPAVLHDFNTDPSQDLDLNIYVGEITV